MAETAKQYDININLEGLDSGGGSEVETPPAPQTPSDVKNGGKNPLLGVQQVFAQMPYGGDVARGIGSINSAAEKVGGIVDGKTGAFGIAMVALGLAKSAHNIASSYVKSVRQSGELQKRAGIYRRDNR